MSDVVVCCTDGSDLSATAIGAALSLLDRERWRVLLVTCVPEPGLELGPADLVPGAGLATAAGVTYAGRDLAAAQEQLIETGRAVAVAVAERVGLAEENVRVLVGSPGPAILDVLDGEDAAVVVVGSRGLGGAARLLLGSVSEYLVRHARCPVLVGPAGVPAEPSGPVVVCVDASDRSVEAGQMAARLFARGLPYALATVLPDTDFPGADRRLAELYERDRATEADRLLAAAATRLGVPDPEFIALEGAEPAHALVDLAKSRPVRALVIGSHGRGAVARVLLGSVAERVVQHAPSLVCVVPRRP